MAKIFKCKDCHRPMRCAGKKQPECTCEIWVCDNCLSRKIIEH